MWRDTFAHFGHHFALQHRRAEATRPAQQGFPPKKYLGSLSGSTENFSMDIFSSMAQHVHALRESRLARVHNTSEHLAGLDSPGSPLFARTGPQTPRQVDIVRLIMPRDGLYGW